LTMREIIGCPPTSFNTFGREDFILLPWPPAITIAYVVLIVYLRDGLIRSNSFVVNVSNFIFICIECDMRVYREWVRKLYA
jgi:hypothetical protein